MADEQLNEKDLNAEEAAAVDNGARVQELEEQLAAAKDQSCVSLQKRRTAFVARNRRSTRRASSPSRSSLATCCR